jgi:predicted nucleic acid-binding protein
MRNHAKPVQRCLLEASLRSLRFHFGKLAARLTQWYEGQVKPTFQDRIFCVDLQIAETCARLHAVRTRPYRDSLLAATALVHGLTLVTRNTADFAGMGLTLINPWNCNT